MTEKRGRSRGPVAVAAGLVVGLLVSGFTVWSASAAAFSGLTDNNSNSWDTGRIKLNDNDNGTTMYSLSGLTPTQNSVANTTRCMIVNYDADISPSGVVKMYSTSTTTGTDLSNYITLTVEVGTYTTAPAAGSFSCNTFSTGGTIYNGTLRNFVTSRTNYSNGLSTGWTPTIAAPDNTRMFRFVATLQDNASANDNSVSGINFTWEVPPS